MDDGLLPVPREVGLCCHFTVPERPGIAALGDCLVAGSGVPIAAVVELGVEGEAALGLLMEPKPLNSGTLSAIVGVTLADSVGVRSEDLGVVGVAGRRSLEV